ncbi:MAG: tetratricopeptide repeat protein, partial [Methanobacteriota archaeon]
VDPPAADEREMRDARVTEDPLPAEQDLQTTRPPAGKPRHNPPLFGENEDLARHATPSPRPVEAVMPVEMERGAPESREFSGSEHVAEGAARIMHARLSEAESVLDIAEEKLVQAEGTIPSGDRILAEVKIKLLEVKIILSELAITMAALEEGDRASGHELAAMAGPITEAEGKLAFAEKKLGSMKVPTGEAKIRIAEVKIKITEAKIRLSQAKFLMHGEEPAIPVPTVSPPPPVAAIPPPPAPEPAPVVRKPIPPAVVEPVQLREEVRDIPVIPDPDEENPDGLVDPAGRTGAGIKKIKFDPPKMGPEESDFGISLDPVKIRGCETEILKDDPVKSLKKLDIAPSGQSAARPEQPSTLEKVKIHSSDVGIVAEKPVAGMVDGEADVPKVVIKATDIERRLVIEDLNQKGIELRKQGKYEEAIACFDRILAMDPDSMTANNNKGVALRTMGRFQEAEPCLAKVVALDASNAGAWFNLGFVLFKLGKYTEANGALDNVLELSPTHAVAWDSKGKVLQKLGREDEAKECFARAKDFTTAS